MLPAAAPPLLLLPRPADGEALCVPGARPPRPPRRRLPRLTPPSKLHGSRAIENEATQHFIDEQKRLLNLVEKKKLSLKDAQLSIEHFWAGSLKRAVINGDVEKGSLMAGKSVSLVKQIQSVKDIFGELIDQMESQVNFELKDLNNG